jgi:hypothetical protein
MHTLDQLKSGALIGTTSLKLSAQLTQIPDEIYQLADTLEILDLSGNDLNELLEGISVLKKLRILFLSNNQFTVFPKVLGQLPSLDMVGFKANRIKEIPENAIPVSLRWLILTDNCIEKLPVSIGACKKLQKVMLAGNRIEVLPDSMAACTSIELLRISANNIHVLPPWLFSLPRLAWLAYAGNPCSTLAYDASTSLRNVSWDSLLMDEKLGEGASGIISKGYWKDQHKSVAVKIFKGTVTSDGYPFDEMQACMKAGVHNNLVHVLGNISNHPEEKSGLVMELISTEYKNLGGPPSFVTCTRDVFSEEVHFLSDTIKIIATGVVSALIQLHKNGIMHGDLYAHNILINDTYEPLLGDFGAATLYTRNELWQSPLLERIEVRAFGYLLDDLILHTTKDEDIPHALLVLRDRCLQTDILLRPDFNEVLSILEGMVL